MGRGEQAVDTILAQGVDDERLLIVNFGGYGVLIIILDTMRLLIDEVSAIFIDEKDDNQPVMAI